MTAKRMLLIFNPKSGKEEFRLNLFEVVEKFTASGFEVTVYPTRAKGDGYRMVQERARDFDYLVCSGGDGTLSEVLDALMPLPDRPVFGYIPSGTTNDFANSLGIPKDILHAAGVIVDGMPARVDVGRFGDRYFSYVAAFGLFTDVPYATSQDLKNVLGHAAYMLEGVKRLGMLHSSLCRIRTPEEEFKGKFILGLISNATSIAGFQIPAEQSAVLDDGLFEVVLVRRPNSLADLHHIGARLLNWTHEESESAILVRKCSEITVETEDKLHWTLDGEYGGATNSVTISNCRQALEIMVPRKED